MDKAQQDALKKAAGIEAAKIVKNGMMVGLGTGSTVRFLVDELGRRVKEEGLSFTGVTTSRRTQEQAEGYGIKILDINDVDHIDVTIDGSDEVDKNFNGIKGGGAALLWEKIVAINSDKIVWIVDASKVVDTIGKFPLPVEVIPFGSAQVIRKFEKRGYKPVLRLDSDGKEVRTDENNFVVDLHLERIDHPQELAKDLIETVGVVEHGLFLNMVDTVIVGDPNGPRTLTNPNKQTAYLNLTNHFPRMYVKSTVLRTFSGNFLHSSIIAVFNRNKKKALEKSNAFKSVTCPNGQARQTATTYADDESYAAVCGASSCSSACGAS